MNLRVNPELIKYLILFAILVVGWLLSSCDETKQSETRQHHGIELYQRDKAICSCETCIDYRYNNGL